MLDIDTHHLTATAVITWPRIDLKGYFIEPDGGHYAQHRRDPKVNLYHVPCAVVAWCRPSLADPDPDAPYTVRFRKFTVGGKSVRLPVATMYFDPRSRDSMTAFDLVARRRLDGVSMELDYLPPVPAVRCGRETHVIEKWWLTGLAILPDPANPRARIFSCDYVPRSPSRRY